MATTAVSLPHQIPHMPMSHVPRVRPARLLKGEPHPNNLPQPPVPAPRNKIWVQGRWRDESSNAAKQARKVQGRRVEKALTHENHGQNIYAYTHIRTHQVVYSLTRIMNNNKILAQLVYHGKKTVPAALRRDMWTPYFSLHFPQNDYGSASGLLTYHRLRELSLQRQLAPPEDLVIATQEDVDRVKAKYDPVDLEELWKARKIKMPKVGELLPKEFRAKKLMSQKMTSVADVAFVLNLQADGPGPEEAQRLKDESREAWWSRITKGARKRARANAVKRKAETDKVAETAKLVKNSSLGLEKHAAERIAMEHQGLARPGGSRLPFRGEEKKAESAAAIQGSDAEPTEKPSEMPSKNETKQERYLHDKRRQFRQAYPDSPISDEDLDASILKAKSEIEAEESLHQEGNAAERGIMGRKAIPTQPREVRVLWSDIRDAAYAEAWPDTVLHAELERAALAKGLGRSVRSVHIISGQKEDPWYAQPGEGDGQDRLGLSLVERVFEMSTEGISEDQTREPALQSLSDQGIEVEAPRRSVWGRVKSMFGR